MRPDRQLTIVLSFLCALLAGACGGAEFTSEAIADSGAGGLEDGGTGGSAAGAGGTGGAGGSAGTAGGSGGSASGSAGAGGLTGTGGSTGTGGNGSGGALPDGSSGAGGQPDGAGRRDPAKHRATADPCDNERQPSTPVPTADAGTFGCRSDADCTAGSNGRCGFTRLGLECSYDRCFTDSDCASEDAGALSRGVCTCGGAASNVCTPAGCRIDADCAGSYCSPTFGACGNYSGVVRYECHTGRDECVDDADCGDGGAFGLGAYCAFAPAVGYWKCSSSQCAG